MSICHDCGDIFFGMVMVAVSPKTNRNGRRAFYRLVECRISSAQLTGRP
jgi:hypothetical protein